MRQNSDRNRGALSIGELSRLTGVNSETIRYYEKIRLVPVPPRSSGGRRVYGAAERRALAFVRRSRNLGFPLHEIRTLLKLGGPEPAPCSEVHDLPSRQPTDIRSKIAH